MALAFYARMWSIMHSVTPSARLKRFRERAGLTQSELAERVGLSEQTISNYEARADMYKHGIPIKNAMKIADALGIEWQDILQGPRKQSQEPGVQNQNLGVLSSESNLGRESSEFAEGFERVPVYGSIAAGPPDSQFTDVLEWVKMPKKNGAARWGRPVKGDSMLPEFEQGDIAIFQERPWQHGDAVHAFSQGEDAFKIAWKEDGKVYLRSMNEDCPDIDAEGWTVKGVCMHRIRKAPGFSDTRDYTGGFNHQRFTRKVQP